jgi:hypothetical protein
MQACNLKGSAEGGIRRNGLEQLWVRGDGAVRQHDLGRAVARRVQRRAQAHDVVR